MKKIQLGVMPVVDIDPVTNHNKFVLLGDEAAIDEDVAIEDGLVNERQIVAEAKAARFKAGMAKVVKNVEKAKALRPENFSQLVIPSRKQVNKLVRDKKSLRVYDRLLFYLRAKHFMKFRDASLINNLVTDARVWLNKNKFDMESEVEYQILANAVCGAFLVSVEELQFREKIKDGRNYDNMAHLNRTVKGNLGKALLPGDRGVFPLRSIFLPTGVDKP